MSTSTTAARDRNRRFVRIGDSVDVSGTIKVIKSISLADGDSLLDDGATLTFTDSSTAYSRNVTLSYEQKN